MRPGLPSNSPLALVAQVTFVRSRFETCDMWIYGLLMCKIDEEGTDDREQPKVFKSLAGVSGEAMTGPLSPSLKMTIADLQGG